MIIAVIGVIALIYWLMTKNKNKNTNKESNYLDGGLSPVSKRIDCGCSAGSGPCAQDDKGHWRCHTNGDTCCIGGCNCNGTQIGGSPIIPKNKRMSTNSQA